MNNVSDLADQDNCLRKKIALYVERLLSFSLLVSVFAGTGLNKNNFFHHSSQG